MSDVIRLLPDSVANQIAAGEVIQRPASVIKELVENAVDAGAKKIQVSVTDAGRTSIQVIDDGKGMSQTDARLSFERHATSKIKAASDLFELKTMGFRGEALASIAAVAQVELKTRPEGDELGTYLSVSGSRVESQESISCPKGSNFVIKNLFFNVPARRKFLKSNQTELGNILSEFERIALVNPEITFALYHNDTEIFNLPASSLRQRIISVFGKKLNQQLYTLEVDTTMIKISGYVGTPESARKKGAHQYFFVNNRYMRHPYFHKAMTEAYGQLIPVGEQVSYFIYFEIDPASIDVNIHPTKTEIKFENEQAIWQILAAAIKESLGKFNAVPTIDFDTEGMPNIPAYQENKVLMPPKLNLNPDFNPFRNSKFDYTRPKVEWESLYQGLEKAKSENQESVISDENEMYGSIQTQPTLYDEEPISDKGNQHYQFKGKFIVTSVKSGLMLIDQHRAHVRVLFDRYIREVETRQGISQGVLFPDVLQLPASESAILTQILDDLSAIGFELTNLGGGSYAINGIPAGIEGLDPVKLVRNMIHTALETGNDVKEEVRRILALTLAKAAAIVYGQVLTEIEMVNLVDSLFACVAPHYTPEGKIILSVMTEAEIEKLFK